MFTLAPHAKEALFYSILTYMIHNEHAIHQKGSLLSRFENYLGEFVYGGIDGCVTTFAVVAGAVGAELSSSIIIILGFANLFADGFAMSIGAYLSTKSEKDTYQKHKQLEYWEVDHLPDVEKNEIREIYQAKGFSGELLERVVEVITSDKDRWVDIMMKEELEMIEEQKSPVIMGAVTYVSFILVGLIPLLVYVWDYVHPIGDRLFLWSSILTAFGFVIIGMLKTYVTQTNVVRGVLETVVLGAIAAIVSYYVGDILEGLVSQ